MRYLLIFSFVNDCTWFAPSSLLTRSWLQKKWKKI
uniref:Uncharacterized protein n=1 Tax=Rhizophora mucronata TaxID=61149 RepID=A0A2P2NTV8_RHIMU